MQELREVPDEDIQMQLDLLDQTLNELHEELEAVGAVHSNKRTTHGSSDTIIGDNIVRVMISASRMLSCVIPYDERTTVENLIRQIKIKFPNEDLADYSLVFAFSVWMEESKKLMENYGMSGEEVLEFKMNPW